MYLSIYIMRYSCIYLLTSVLIYLFISLFIYVYIYIYLYIYIYICTPRDVKARLPSLKVFGRQGCLNFLETASSYTPSSQAVDQS